MSRRSRRRRGVSGGVGWLGKTLMALIVVGMIAAGVIYALVRNYLHSEGFRDFLADKAGALSGVEGRFSPFQWEGLAVDTPLFEGEGTGMVRDVRLDGLHSEIGVGGLSRGFWEVKGARVQRMEMEIDTRSGRERSDARTLRADGNAAAKNHMPGWLPNKVQLEGLDVGHVQVQVLTDQGRFIASGPRARVVPASRKDSYQVDVAGGSLKLPFALLSELRIDHLKLFYQNNEVRLNRAEVSVWKNGRLEASGEWNGTSGQYFVEGDVDGVKCEEVFNEDWAKRFVGKMQSNFIIDNHSGTPSAHGTLSITDGTLTALPMLDSLAAYADTRRFRVLALNDAHTDWNWKDGEIVFSDLVLSSDGLIRLEGSMIIRGRDLDGSFRLGLAPGTLATIPGAETDVFFPGERGLVWAPLRITGTLEDPIEDLSDRLIEAAGMRMFDIIPETGEKVFKFSKTVIQEASGKAMDVGSGAIDAGSKVLDTGTGVIGGVLGGILGGGSRTPEPEPDPVPEEEGRTDLENP